MPQKMRCACWPCLFLTLDHFHSIKSCKICTYFQVVIHTIRLPKNSTVGDVINDLKTKVTPLKQFVAICWFTKIVKMLFFQLYLYLLFIYLFIISNAIAILSMCNSFQNGLRCSNCLILVAQNRLNCLVLMLKFACSRFSITRYIRYYFHFLSQDILPD